MVVGGDSMSHIEKECVFCGQSCAGQARIKDAKGNYAHKACAEQHAGSKSAEPEPVGVGGGLGDGLGDGLGGGMDDLLGDLEPIETEAMSAASACPGCGRRMDAGAVVCMNCGFDSQSGKSLKTKRLDRKPKRDSKAASIGAAAGGMALKPILPVLGAVIGGLIGAGIWTLIAYQFNYEIGLIAIVVGVLCGIGAAIGAGGEGGAFTGGMAALVAMGSICLGKYAAISMIVDDVYGGDLFTPLTLNEVDDQMVMTSIADDITRDYLDAGQSVEWPDPTIYIDAAIWPDDYPRDIIDETWWIWDGMSFTEKAVKRRALGQEWDIPMSEVDDDWVMEEIAYGLCSTRIAQGESIQWDDLYLPLEVSTWPDDYPEHVQSNATERWSAMGPDDQHTYRLDVLDEVNSQRTLSGEAGQAIVKAGFISTFMHPRQLFFMLLAVGAAFKLGSGDE